MSHHHDRRSIPATAVFYMVAIAVLIILFVWLVPNLGRQVAVDSQVAPPVDDAVVAEGNAALAPQWDAVRQQYEPGYARVAPDTALAPQWDAVRQQYEPGYIPW